MNLEPLLLILAVDVFLALIVWLNDDDSGGKLVLRPSPST